MRHVRPLILTWVVGWGWLSTLWCASAGWQLSATADETFYADAGLRFWRHWTHKYLLQAGTMPLPVETTGLVLHLSEQLGWTASALDDLETWLPWARLGTLLFWWLLLGAAFVLARWHAGTFAGCLAVALLACEFNLLAHACLATTDLAFSACLTAFLTAQLLGHNSPFWWRRTGLPALLLALTFLSKASALVYAPVCVLAVEVWCWVRHQHSAFSLARMPQDSPAAPRSASQPAVTPQHNLRTLLVAQLQLWGTGLAMLCLLCPTAYKGIWFQIRHNQAGVGPVFLLGQLGEHGFWYYFLATLVIKMSLPVLGLLAGVLVCRLRLFWTTPVLAAVGIVALSPCYRVQHGIRMILPAVALLLVGLSIALGRWLREIRPARRGWLLVPLAATLAVGVTNAIVIWPHGLCFTNALWGGTSNGYLALDGANYDWGQGLWELRRWQEREQVTNLDLWYWGPEPMLKYVPGMRPVNLLQTSPGNPLEQSQGRLLAVSASYLYGGWYHRANASHFNILVKWEELAVAVYQDYPYP